jgi:oligopeptidase A
MKSSTPKKKVAPKKVTKKMPAKPVKKAAEKVKETPEVNPFLEDCWRPRYVDMTPELCVAAFEAELPEAERAFENVVKRLDISWQGLVLDPMIATRKLFSVWGTLSHLSSVVNSDGWRAVEAEWRPKLIAFVQVISQSKPLYEGLLSLLEMDTLEPWQKHVATRMVEGMRNAGVGLVGAQKNRFNKIQKELALLSMKFQNNVLDAEKAAKIEIAPEEANGIPADLLKGKGPWTLGLDFATFDSVMRYAESSAVRERFWRARATRASSGKGNNAPLIERILVLRQQLAKLIGYKDYAHLSTATKMAATPANVAALLDPMAAIGRAAAKVESANLEKFAKANGFKGKMQPWDGSYWIEKESQQLFGYDEEALREYFPMEYVLEGMFALIKKLFDVTIERETGKINAWHKDVRFYNVKDKQGKIIAGMYFDPFARPGTKNGGAWVNEIRLRDFETRQQCPIATVCCNQKMPVGKQPATMNFYEISTLFHEMGHALQAMLTAVDSPTCACMENVEWDAVEIASQFFEQFPYDPAILRGLSKHVTTGKPLPIALADKIAQKRTYRAGNALVRQLLFAQTDLYLHSTAYPGRFKKANDVKQSFSKKLLPKPMHEDDRFLNAFTHIFAGGYCAGYYSYKWSETLSADIYGAYCDLPAAKRKAFAKRYRDTILGLGGSLPAAEVFRMLMGRDPDAKAILRQQGLLED